MRNRIPMLVIMAFAAIGFRPAAAQEIGQTVSITGCLVQEDDDGEVEFLLEGAVLGQNAVAEVELVAGDGVSLAGHVGHTVEVTGVVVADEEEEEDEGEEAEEEDEDDDDDELHIRVSDLGHVAASCSDGRR